MDDFAKEIRAHFPMLAKNIVYLDSAATALKPKCVIDRIRSFYEEEYGTVHRGVYSLSIESSRQYSAVREKIRSFLNAASSDEIVFTKGTTEGINLIASCLGKTLQRGDEIILSVMEHHSNLVPWLMLAEEKGVVLKFIPVNDHAELMLDEFIKLLSSKTKLVSLAHISNVTGTLNPIEKIIALSHERGSKVLIDGAQSAPHMKIDVQKLDCDFFVFSGHKVYGPTGVGILYGKKAILESLPPYQGGGDMVATVTLEKATYQMPPLRFEAGTPMIAEVIGLGEAISFIESIGMTQIAAWEQKLLEYATKQLTCIPGLRLIGTAKEKGAILSFTIEGVHPLDLATFLDMKNIAVRTGHLCAQPLLQRFGLSTLTRVSFGMYNTTQEIDLFVAALHEALAVLKAVAQENPVSTSTQV